MSNLHITGVRGYKFERIAVCRAFSCLTSEISKIYVAALHQQQDFHKRLPRGYCRLPSIVTRYRLTRSFPFPRDVYGRAQIRQALGLVVVLLFVAGLLVLVGLVECLEHYLETDLGYE